MHLIYAVESICFMQVPCGPCGPWSSLSCCVEMLHLSWNLVSNLKVIGRIQVKAWEQTSSLAVSSIGWDPLEVRHPEEWPLANLAEGPRSKQIPVENSHVPRCRYITNPCFVSYGHMLFDWFARSQFWWAYVGLLVCYPNIVSLDSFGLHPKLGYFSLLIASF